ncbi:SUMF1/EgtB/PvdO family nonheme iron enzyme [bacterium]|nr:SUMF1/EgtB/PvdO family nonheme iron enzyme [bacterium]
MKKYYILIILLIILLPINVEADSGISLVFVKGSNFQMKDENLKNNQVRNEDVQDFFISKYEITQSIWEEIMETNHSRNKKANNPVENISWYDAIEFCNKMSIREELEPVYSGSGKNIKSNFQNNGYRLPTEAEWEFAARGGVKSRSYKFGTELVSEEEEDDTNESTLDAENPVPVLTNIRVRHTTNTLKGGDGGVSYKPVGSSKPNELGIYDLVGNVFEFCWEGRENYSLGTRLDPLPPKNSIDAVGFRVVRSNNKKEESQAN